MSREAIRNCAPIAVGDLVIVVKAGDCGCVGKSTGLIRTVVAFKNAAGKCTSCGHVSFGFKAELSGPAPWAEWHVAPHRLKRIPPLSELEGEKRDEEITA